MSYIVSCPPTAHSDFEHITMIKQLSAKKS